MGRALAPSVLDLTDSNPLTRLRNSEFRSLQGLRNSLRSEIDRNVVMPRNSTAMPKVRVTFGQTRCRFVYFLFFFFFCLVCGPKKTVDHQIIEPMANFNAKRRRIKIIFKRKSRRIK